MASYDDMEKGNPTSIHSTTTTIPPEGFFFIQIVSEHIIMERAIAFPKREHHRNTEHSWSNYLCAQAFRKRTQLRAYTHYVLYYYLATAPFGPFVVPQ